MCIGNTWNALSGLAFGAVVRAMSVAHARLNEGGDIFDK
jgi:hypothetical protein